MENKHRRVELSRRQADLLQSLLSHAREAVPFYAGAGDDLLDFPIVSKATIRSNYDAFLSTGTRCARSRLIGFLQQPHPLDRDELPFDHDISVELTSGSSGLPFCIPRTKAERVAISLNLWKFRKSIDPHVSPQSFYAIIHAPRNQVTPTSFQELEDHIARNAIRWIHAYPGYLERWAADRTQNPRPAPAAFCFVESTGAFLGQIERNSIEAGLGVQVVNQFGCREVSVAAYAVGGEDFMPLSDNVVVELLNAKGERIHATGMAGRIVVTGLHQRLLPFIRYDTGDTAELTPGPDGSHRLMVHEGRPHHLIHGSDRRFGPQVFKAVMIEVYKEIGLVDLDYLQIRQVATRRFLVVVRPSSHAEAMRGAIARVFNSYGILPFEAEFQLGEAPAMLTGGGVEEKDCLFTNRYFVDAP